MAPFWTAKKPNSYIGWGKSTHLGYSLPLALGAKVAKPEKIVVNVMGDAAFGMSGTELATASRNKIATLTIVLNNSCLGGYDKHIPVASRRFGTRFLQGEYCQSRRSPGDLCGTDRFPPGNHSGNQAGHKSDAGGPAGALGNDHEGGDSAFQILVIARRLFGHHFSGVCLGVQLKDLRTDFDAKPAAYALALGSTRNSSHDRISS